jgi:hypothetical protein
MCTGPHRDGRRPDDGVRCVQHRQQRETELTEDRVGTEYNPSMVDQCASSRPRAFRTSPARRAPR